ncbi:MAG: bifunctional nicotinamidase/pyrazinamidase [Saprospiraceae bacterium]|nr:MAG: bifunctional pyrazinamidase/nicotinamidase [Bacteroidetes bacterium OLB9]MCO6462591.1 bifunctional nicotinamidase/pyrazinamidase [Saprospiraceae bacterium]MCZ2338135.1 bifunctional nicotinamidase/pyrazinamidase [Chitinophagales bacterium]
MNAFIIVDIQNDFCPGGALAVHDGDRIIPVINKLVLQFDTVVLTQDWHPDGHSSFASSHPGKQPYETIELSYGTQVLWPDHCVQGTSGADFHPDLEQQAGQLILRKGFRKGIDSYSAFYENDQTTVTGLSGYLKNRGVDTLYICGLATDFCVKWSALDGIKEGFSVYVVEDAVAGIDLNDSVAAAWKEMEAAGVQRIISTDIALKSALA